jgi:hypothetical protein
MSANRLPRDLAFNDYHVRKDPGASGVLHTDMSNVTYAIVTADAESRVLQSPQRAGIRITISLDTDGGDLTVTTAGDELINDGTTAGILFVMADAGDAIDLVSYRSGGSTPLYHWLVTGNNGAALSAT